MDNCVEPKDKNPNSAQKSSKSPNKTNVTTDAVSKNSTYIEGNKIFYANGDVYEGDFNKSNFKKEGFGVYTYTNGDVYKGYYKDDIFDKYATIIFADGGSDVRDIMSFFNENGEPYLATLNYSNGSTYKGYVNKDFFPNGFGEYSNNQGCSFLGYFSKGAKLQGIQSNKFEEGLEYEALYNSESERMKTKELEYEFIIIKNGDKLIYQGECSNDFTKDGIGEYFTDTYSYLGQFEKDMLSGVGDIRYKNNSYYIGDFENNKRNGLGCFTWENEDELIGHFENDKIEGFGVHFSDKKNIKYSGEFSKSKFHGKGDLSFIEENKQIYIDVLNNEISKVSTELSNTD